MEEKIKQIYMDLLRAYNVDMDLLRTYTAEYSMLLTNKTFNEECRALQGSLYVTRRTIMRLEKDFPTICNREHEWKDENFK